MLRLFGKDAHRGQLRVIYQRTPSSDRTAGLPSSRHMYYVAKGWTAIAIDDDAPAPGKAASLATAAKK